LGVSESGIKQFFFLKNIFQKKIEIFQVINFQTQTVRVFKNAKNLKSYFTVKLNSEFFIQGEEAILKEKKSLNFFILLEKIFLKNSLSKYSL